jgi:ribosomal protein L11 methyltransferase
MEWVEISVRVDGEGAEPVAEVLQRYVSQGVAIEQALPQEIWPEAPVPGGPVVVKAYILNDAHAAAKREKIEEGLAYLRMMLPTIPEPEFQIVRDEDWADAWKKHYKPVRVGKRIIISPAWMDAEPGPEDVLIELDPGMAFGTGTHPTTQLCLQACEWFCRPATTMVDIGAGSGILSIAAAKLGCYKVLGREIDEVAVAVAQENVTRNGVGDRVTVQHGSVEGLVSSARHFDIGMANITARVILQLVPTGLQHIIWPGGKFIFSGVIEDQTAEVVAALDAIDLQLLDTRQMGDWMLLITRRRYPN